MRSCPARFTGVLILVFLLLVLAACGGGGAGKTTPPQTPAKVTLTGPGSVTVVSLIPGQFAQLTPVALDASGNTLSNETFTYTASNLDPNDKETPFVSVSNSGLVCAGTWDSLSVPVVCSPSSRKSPDLPPNLQTPGVGKANVTATALSVTSSAVTVYVHQPVDNITVTCTDTSTQKCPVSVETCLSQTQTQQYTAIAKSQGVDVTQTVGAFTWTAQGTSAKLTDATNGIFTAQGPGRSQIFASSNNVQSTSAIDATGQHLGDFVGCPVKQISLHVANGSDTSVTLEKSATKTLTADLIDTKDKPLTSVTLAFGSSQPLVATGSASFTAASAGTTAITASCAPPACNTGLPGTAVYSNAFVANVNGTTAATTVYVGSTQGTSVVPVPTDTNTPGTAITLGDKPNSMVFNHRGTALYIGTATGLIVLTPSTNTVTAPNTSLPGKVLAIAPDDNTLLISDVNNGKVYAYAPNASSNQLTTLGIPGATAAIFTPDSGKAYIVGNGSWTSWTPTTTPVPVSVGGAANDVAFLASGSVGYIAGSGSGVAARLTCNDAALPSVATSGVPTSIQALADGQHLVAVSSPNIDIITATQPGASTPPTNAGCPAPENAASFVQTSASATPISATPFGAPTGFTAPQLILTSAGDKAFVTSDQAGRLLGYDVKNNVSAPIQLLGGVTQTFTGGVTLDGKLLYVGAGGTNTLHKIDLTTGLDVTQVPMSFVPDMVAVLPK